MEERALEDARQHVKEQERDEYEALEEAIPDLQSLERYERRTSSRQKRAICEFVNIKLMRRICGITGSPTEANIAADCEG